MSGSTNAARVSDPLPDRLWVARLAAPHPAPPAIHPPAGHRRDPADGAWIAAQARGHAADGVAHATCVEVRPGTDHPLIGVRAATHAFIGCGCRLRVELVEHRERVTLEDTRVAAHRAGNA